VHAAVYMMCELPATANWMQLVWCCLTFHPKKFSVQFA